jgi:hypothetical protein
VLLLPLRNATDTQSRSKKTSKLRKESITKRDSNIHRSSITMDDSDIEQLRQMALIKRELAITFLEEATRRLNGEEPIDPEKRRRIASLHWDRFSDEAIEPTLTTLQAVEATIITKLLQPSIDRIVRHVIKGNRKSVPDTPSLLLRYATSDTAAPYDQDLGIFSTMLRSGSKIKLCSDSDGLKAHFAKNNKTPTVWISLSESPGRLINIIRPWLPSRRDPTSKSDGQPGVDFSRWEEDSSRVIIIDPVKLRAFGTFFARTTELAAKYNLKNRSRLHHDGVDYVTDTHWLAKGWIPKECIVNDVPAKQFVQVCQGMVF